MGLFLLLHQYTHRSRLMSSLALSASWLGQQYWNCCSIGMSLASIKQDNDYLYDLFRKTTVIEEHIKAVGGRWAGKIYG